MITFARDLFAREHGLMHIDNADRRRLLMQNILHNVPVQDRQAAVHTMNTVFLDETKRLHSAAQQAVPSWIAGQQLPADIKTPILNGHGGNVNITA